MAVKRKSPERALHKAVVQYFKLALPANAFWWHTPNGGKRSVIEGAIFKALGVKPGIPDLFILYDGRLHGIELKAGTALSVAQHECMEEIVNAGGTVAVARSIDQVKEHLKRWGLLKAARKAA